MKRRTRNAGFWKGVFVGIIAGRLISRIKIDQNQIARSGYNLFASHYEPWLAHVKGIDETRQELIEKLDLEPGDRVLEVCVGTGANLPLIAERIGREGKIFGLDISEGMLAQAQKKLGDIPCPVELLQGNAEELPYPDNSFDAVLNFGAINFINDEKKAIDEMIRVAKPGASIVIGDETISPDGPYRNLLRRISFLLVPGLNPPIAFVAEYGARLSFVLNGFMYIISLRKPKP